MINLSFAGVAKLCRPKKAQNFKYYAKAFKKLVATFKCDWVMALIKFAVKQGSQKYKLQIREIPGSVAVKANFLDP